MRIVLDGAVEGLRILCNHSFGTHCSQSLGRRPGLWRLQNGIKLPLSIWNSRRVIHLQTQKINTVHLYRPEKPKITSRLHHQPRVMKNPKTPTSPISTPCLPFKPATKTTQKTQEKPQIKTLSRYLQFAINSPRTATSVTEQGHETRTRSMYLRPNCWKRGVGDA